ncbi:MAG: carbohydrate binding family 9 domain-containing protein [Acidobacteria bacterium]|nr:carbohydrate binding family 9 domain-containing protein [Acidobacteriota bacterium]
MGGSCVLLWLGMAGRASAQVSGTQNGSTHGRKTIRAVATENPPVLDGNLDEAIWRQAPAATGFLQKDPQEGQPATENTEFRVVYTPTTLYIGVICFDGDPSGILANERRRDGNLENDDSVTIVLDTFHDHRNSYKFTTNPLGTQQDALVTDEGNNSNENWDEKWDVAAHINSEGWVAEFAIPFKSVRVPESEDGMTWGLDMQRSIRRKNESTSWDNFRRGFDIASVSQAGHMTGLEAIETGLRLRIKPYLLGGFSQAVSKQSSVLPGADPFRTVTTDASDIGLEVMKYRITPSLTADFTWNTDFAQTEVDNQQINLDRFPLFFPEKREFFQEGAGIFEFGIAEGENRGSSVMKLFHTRQLGLSPKRQPVPIVGGGRVTGKLAGFGVGLINVQTESFAPENIRASNYSVLRVKRDVFNRSTVGAFFLSREQGGTPDYNRVYGFDTNFVFYKYFSVGGFLSKSSSCVLLKSNRCATSGEAPQNRGTWSTAGAIRWDSDFLNLETSWLAVDPDFRDDLGDVRRKDQRMSSTQLAFKPRLNNTLIRQLIFRSRVDYIMNQHNHLETRTTHNAFEIHFQDGGTFGWVPHTYFDTFSRPFDIGHPNVVLLPPRSYSWWKNIIRYSPSPSRRISGQIINWGWNVGYYGVGTLHEFDINPRLRLTNQLSVQVSYGINKATFPVSVCVDKSKNGCGFTDHVVNARVNYNLNNQWLTSTVLQYNNADGFWGYNFRLNYIFRPGDDFFLIYNEGRQIDGTNHNSRSGEKDRTVQAKLTYSFDF